jgi:hypothetical protein
MRMIFDSETMFDWLGKPRDEDLPSTYCIRYARAWKRAGMPGLITSEEADTIP